MREDLVNEGVVKEESVMHLKTKVIALQGKLFLTPKHLVLDSHKTGVSGLGILGMILKRQVEKKNFGFEWELSDIKSIAQGKHGVQNNVLEVTNKNDETFRILVKNYQEWETEIGRSR